MTAGLPLKSLPLSIPCGCVRYGGSDTEVIIKGGICIMEQAYRCSHTMTQGTETLGCVHSRGVVEGEKNTVKCDFLVSAVSVVSE